MAQRFRCTSLGKLDKELAEVRFSQIGASQKEHTGSREWAVAVVIRVGVINDAPEHRLNKWLRKRDQNRTKDEGTT